MNRQAGHSLALILLASASWPSTARGDGGTLRDWKRQENYEIAIFTEPTPLGLGRVDISVLLLDPMTGEPVPDARVDVEVVPEGRPDLAGHHPATKDLATNKLLYAAVFELRWAGRSEVIVTADGPKGHAETRFGIDVSGDPPFRRDFWVWMLWPVPVIAIYVVHRGLVARKDWSRS